MTVLARELLPLLEDAEPGEALRKACENANGVTWREASDSGLEGAATTLVVALVDDSNNLWLANVGDSRAYVVGDGRMTQLTQDHSWVGEQVRSGRMTPAEARSSDRRNLITRSVGFSELVEVDLQGPLRLQAGETLILCSDGLYDQVSDDEIAAVAAEMNPDDAASGLVEMANERGGPDNISVVVCAVGRSPLAPQRASSGARRPPALTRFWPVILLIGLAAVSALTALFVLN